MERLTTFGELAAGDINWSTERLTVLTAVSLGHLAHHLETETD